MNKPFESYYLDRPLRNLVDELSDRNLDVDRHREEVNQRVMSLVIQYLGTYLQVPSRDPREIGHASQSKKAEMKRQRTATGTNEGLILKALMGIPQTGEVREDFPGLDCLMDTASTAALFKEVAFNRDFHTNWGQYVGIDLGSGTGILTLASVIAGRRSRVNGFTLGLDREAKSVARATEVLSRLVGRQEVQLQAVDIRTPRLVEQLFQGLPLSFWISETIQDLTPEIEIANGRLRYRGNMSDPAFAAWVQFHNLVDPFCEVLGNTIQGRPSFTRDVQNGVTAMFPDAINKTYVPGGQRGGQLKLKTSPQPDRYRRLPTIGEEFASYEQPVSVSSTDPRWMRFPPRDL